MQVVRDAADTNTDNNPMLRDGVTGDWYAKKDYK